MAATKPLSKEINFYLEQLNTEQKKAVLSVVKTFAREEDWWTDDKYIAAMDKRFAEMEKGKVKSLSLDELETNARKLFRSKKSGVK